MFSCEICYTFKNIFFFCHSMLWIIDASLLKIWVKVFKNGPIKICGRQPLKNFKSIFLKAAFHKFYWFILEYLDSYVQFIELIINAQIPKAMKDSELFNWSRSIQSYVVNIKRHIGYFFLTYRIVIYGKLPYIENYRISKTSSKRWSIIAITYWVKVH